VQRKKNLVCKLHKSLYGLKQEPRQWYKKFNEFMRNSGFHRCEEDHCCYVKKNVDSYIILALYVDDMLIVGANMAEIDRLKKQLSENFEMKDLGPTKQILGMRISRDRFVGILNLSQEKYIEKFLSRFNVGNAKTRNTPLETHLKFSKRQYSQTEEEESHIFKVPYISAVGSLMYAMVCTRPDITHAVGVVSKFLSNPGKGHWEGVKWILRYLKGTSKMHLSFKRSNLTLQGFSDADLGGDLDGRKSTIGYIFTLGGTTINRKSKLQGRVSFSTTEAEYVVISEAAKEMIWLKNLLKELGKEKDESSLFSDSQSAICLAKNPILHSKCKHIELKYHFIRNLINDGDLILLKIPGAENPTDMLTKTVTTTKLRLCIASTCLREN